MLSSTPLTPPSKKFMIPCGSSFVRFPGSSRFSSPARHLVSHSVPLSVVQVEQAVSFIANNPTSSNVLWAW